MFRNDHATAAGSKPAYSAASLPGYFTDGDPATGVPATSVTQDWLNTVTEELVNTITSAGIALDKADDSQLVAAIRAMTGHDIAFMAGRAADGTGDDVAAQTYGALQLTRDINILSEVGYAEVAPTGAALIFDVLLNGVSIYTTAPQIAAGANVLTAGVLTSAPNPLAASAGDRLEFKITQIGSIIAGQKVTFSIKGLTQ